MCDPATGQCLDCQDNTGGEWPTLNNLKLGFGVSVSVSVSVCGSDSDSVSAGAAEHLLVISNMV